MICKHCGQTVKPAGPGSGFGGLFGQRSGPKCPSSPSGKHVGCSGESMVCKYCGQAVKPAGLGSGFGGLFGQRGGPTCPQSPHGKHELAE